MVKLTRGIEYFNDHHEEAINYISTELDYSADDAREWLKTVEFEADVTNPGDSSIVKTAQLLAKAGLMDPEKADNAPVDMIQRVR